jgi:hypothetical protein
MKKKYEEIVNEYIIAFVRKHDTVFLGWIGWNRFGEVAEFYGDYYISFDDIRRDIDTNQPKRFIFQWQDDSAHYGDLLRINYSSYIAGARFNVLN